MLNQHALNRPGHPRSIRFLSLAGVLVGIGVLAGASSIGPAPRFAIRDANDMRAYWSQAPAQPGRRADSLVLERTACFGTCPAYRLRVSSTGLVSFRSRNPGDGTVASDSMSPAVLVILVARADAAGFFRLPPRLMDDRSICANVATDHPTVTVTIFTETGHRTVEDYHGCFQRSDHSLNQTLISMRAFETAIDSALRSARWVRPAR